MIPKEATELLSTGGFIRCFFAMIRQNPCISQNDAYEKAETEYKKHFGKRKYSGYDSFRKMKCRYLKKRVNS
jgi:hypothetical protein